MNDYEFLEKFGKNEIDPAQFAHKEHLRLAWLLIKEQGDAGAIVALPDLIESYVTHVGAADKFNKTLTIASALIISRFMKQSKALIFKDFLSEYPELSTNFKGLVYEHYSPTLLLSDEAKKEFLEPDLIYF